MHAEPVWVSTGQTYSQLWGSLDTAGKSKPRSIGKQEALHPGHPATRSRG